MAWQMVRAGSDAPAHFFGLLESLSASTCFPVDLAAFLLPLLSLTLVPVRLLHLPLIQPTLQTPVLVMLRVHNGLECRRSDRKGAPRPPPALLSECVSQFSAPYVPD
jgi:hypothetical protein